MIQDDRILHVNYEKFGFCVQFLPPGGAVKKASLQAGRVEEKVGLRCRRRERAYPGYHLHTQKNAAKR